MAIFAIIMSVNFTACSSEDDPTISDDGIITNEKKLVAVNESSTYDKVSVTFSYDSKDRLSKIIRIYSSNNNKVESTWVWGNNTIMSGSHIFNLSEGHVVSTKWDEFKYNSSNQLIFKGLSTDGSVITWENGKMMSCDDGHTTFYYDGKTCSKGYFPLISPAIFDRINCGAGYYVDYEIGLFMAHPELCGIRTKQLPYKVVKDDGEDITLDYTFTKDGYIESCTLKTSREQGEDFIEILTFEWE